MTESQKKATIRGNVLGFLDGKHFSDNFMTGPATFVTELLNDNQNRVSHDYDGNDSEGEQRKYSKEQTFNDSGGTQNKIFTESSVIDNRSAYISDNEQSNISNDSNGNSDQDTYDSNGDVVYDDQSDDTHRDGYPSGGSYTTSSGEFSDNSSTYDSYSSDGNNSAY